MSRHNAIQQFLTYPFESDENFTNGVKSILGSANAQDQNDILNKAKVFYFSKITGHQITWEDVQELASSGSNEAPEDPAIHSNLPEESKESAEGVVETSRTLSFAEITALIESNETHLIPNNEEISGGVNESIPSEAKQRPPKKPWEIDAEKAT